MSEPAVSLPLDGIRVLDFAQFLAGPAGALRLADLGADVIKIERPDGGDLCRSLVINDQRIGGDSLLFHTFNRNKRSVCADLKSHSDLERVRELIRTADVMIHNFRPGVMERIGLSYESVQLLNPRLVYASVTGYGSKGPWRSKPGQDLLVQSLSGISWLQGNAEDGPVPVGFAILDVATGANLVQGVLAALLRRTTTGKGGLVEVSLLESALDLQFEQLTAYFNDTDPRPSRSAINNANLYGAAPYGIYATEDGFLALAMTPLNTLTDLLDCADLGEFQQSDAFAKRDEIKAIVARRVAQKSTQAWLDILEAADVWCAPILSWAELAETEGFAALRPLQEIDVAGSKITTTRCPIRLDGSTIISSAPAPGLGAHTREILG